MRIILHGTCLATALMLLAVCGGCGSAESGDKTPQDVSGPPPKTDGKDDEHDHSGHDHSGHGHDKEHKGPHGGHVIELGRNHQYHAELVENEAAGTVTVYILDKDLKELAIDQSSITMNLTVEGQSKTFELAAAGATDGKTARFDATGRALFEALHDHEASGKLRVSIDGTPYSGDVEHHHDDHKH